MERGEDPAEREERLREVLGVLGRKHGVLWLVLAWLTVAADRFYRPGRRFTAILLLGCTVWGLFAVALPAWAQTRALVRLRDDLLGGASRRLTDHLWLVSLNALAAAYAVAGLALGWPALLPALVCPLLALWSCLALSRPEP